MRTSWADSVENASSASSDNHGTGGGLAPTKPTYIPPHRRNRPPILESPALSFSGPPSGNDRGGGPAGGSWWAGGSTPDFGRQGYNTGGRGSSVWGNRDDWDRGRDREVYPFGNDDIDDDAERAFSEQENSGINFDAYEDIPVDTSGNNVPPPVNTLSGSAVDAGDTLLVMHSAAVNAQSAGDRATGVGDASGGSSVGQVEGTPWDGVGLSNAVVRRLEMIRARHPQTFASSIIVRSAIVAKVLYTAFVDWLVTFDAVPVSGWTSEVISQFLSELTSFLSLGFQLEWLADYIRSRSQSIKAAAGLTLIGAQEVALQSERRVLDAEMTEVAQKVAKLRIQLAKATRRLTEAEGQRAGTESRRADWDGKWSDLQAQR